MHEQLIGQQASLSVPCTLDAAVLVLGFIDELMEVSGSEADSPEALEVSVKEAVGAVCRHGADNAGCHVVASFEIHSSGMDVRLTCESHDDADVRHIVVVREA